MVSKIKNTSYGSKKGFGGGFVLKNPPKKKQISYIEDTHRKGVILVEQSDLCRNKPYNPLLKSFSKDTVYSKTRHPRFLKILEKTKDWKGRQL